MKKSQLFSAQIGRVPFYRKKWFVTVPTTHNCCNCVVPSAWQSVTRIFVIINIMQPERYIPYQRFDLKKSFSSQIRSTYDYFYVILCRNVCDLSRLVLVIIISIHFFEVIPLPYTHSCRCKWIASRNRCKTSERPVSLCIHFVLTLSTRVAQMQNKVMSQNNNNNNKKQKI